MKKKQSPIKLYEVGQEQDGLRRFQSQLWLSRDSVDFIMRDGEMKVWQNNFVKYEGEYIIVNNIEEMRMQAL